MRILKWTLGSVLALGAIATLVMFCVEVSILGIPTTISQIASVVGIILCKPVILVLILFTMGIPFVVLTVHGGNIAGAHMKRIMMGTCLTFALVIFLLPVGVWAIAARTITYGPYLLLERGEYDRARARFEKLQSAEPPEARPWRYACEIAQCHYGKREYSTAIALCKSYLEDATRRSSDNAPWMYLLLGDCYVGLGDAEEAKKCYDGCPKLVPNSDQRIQDITKDHALGGTIKGADYHP